MAVVKKQKRQPIASSMQRDKKMGMLSQFHHSRNKQRVFIEKRYLRGRRQSKEIK
jgi:hypothetical protein